MRDCHVTFYVDVFMFFPHFLKITSTQGKVSEQSMLYNASPHNNNFDKNKRGHVAHCDGLPFSSKFQVCLIFILY